MMMVVNMMVMSLVVINRPNKAMVNKINRRV